MRERTPSSRGRSAQHATIAVEVALFTPRAGELSVLLVRSRDASGRSHWMVPWDGPREESLDAAAMRVGRELLAGGRAPALLEQLRAVDDHRRGSREPDVRVAYLGVVAAAELSGGETDAEWMPLSQLPALATRERETIEAAAAALRVRVDVSPLAFRLLPERFTLTELQGVYELLLGRRLHKASFRRTLLAAALVEATDEWRSEGRGRPAQLFRYAPKRRRGVRRAVRFDLLTGD